MATKKRKPRKKRYCPGQFGPGGKRVKKRKGARVRCKGQMAGSYKGGRPKRRKTTTVKRRKAAKRSTAKRTTHRRTKGVRVHGHMVYGAAAQAVRKKRARKGKPKRERPVYGHYGRTASGGGHEFTREELRYLEGM